MDAKTNGNAPVNYVPDVVDHDRNYYAYGDTGITKREAFAMAAMQGILANRVYDPPRRNNLEGMAEDAVSAADALLAELAKERA